MHATPAAVDAPDGASYSVEIQGLTVRYGDLCAVDALDLKVARGTLFGLLGPNGAGKTTTLSCVAGLRIPTAGQVRVQGIDVVADPLGARAHIGFVPQHLALYPQLSVRKNINIFGGLHGLSGSALRDRCAWAMALAQLDGRAEAKVGSLSGGMQRRLNLACSLLHDPAVVICDEPTTGVDAQSRNHLFDTIRALHAEGRTVIYTTHYMQEVEALCERVAIIDRGRVVAQNTLAALLAAPPRAEGGGRTWRVTADADAAAIEAALAGLGGAKVTEEPRTLEQVFLELTGHALRDGAAS